MYTIFLKDRLIKPISLLLLLLLFIPILYFTNRVISLQTSTHKVTISKDVIFMLPETFEFYINDFDINAISFTTEMTYTDEKNSVSFQYPSCFTMNEKSFEGGEIIKHLDFQCKSEGTFGLFQIWRYKNGLLSFLTSAKSVASASISDFSESPVKNHTLHGYLWEYTITNDQMKKFRVNEAFFENNGKIYRMSYFVPLNKWNSEQEQLFNDLIMSLKINA